MGLNDVPLRDRRRVEKFLGIPSGSCPQAFIDAWNALDDFNRSQVAESRLIPGVCYRYALGHPEDGAPDCFETVMAAMGVDVAVLRAEKDEREGPVNVEHVNC
jgi:hypothetical protein